MNQIADLLEARIEALQKKWTARLADACPPGRSATPEIADCLPAFMRQVVAALREPSRYINAPAVAEPSAPEYGAQQLPKGFDLEAVVREYGLLQQLILDHIEEVGAAVAIRQVRQLTDLFTAAIAEATAEYGRRAAATRKEASSASPLSAATANAFTQAPVAIVILHGERDVVTLANPAACRLWGLTHEQLIQRPLLEVLPHLKDHNFIIQVAQVRRTGEPIVGREVPATLAQLDGGGDTGFYNFVYQPLRAADGSVVDVLMVATEVTQEVQARHAAEATSAEFEAMFNSMPDGAYVGDERGVRRANPAGLALLGIDHVEKLHGPASERLRTYQTRDAATGEVLPTGKSPLLRALAGEVVREEYLTWHPVQGRDIRLRTVASPIWLGGKITGAVVLHTDITEQHRALAALHRSEENFRTLADAIPQQVWTATPDGALDFVNQRTVDYFALSKEQILGAGWQAVIHPEDRPGCSERWLHSLKTFDEYAVEFRLRRADGTYRWHLGRAFAVRDSNGEVGKWFGTNTDFDEAKRIREELEQARVLQQQLLHEAEEANRAKDEFLAMLGHELRNPLAPIATALQLMKLRAGEVLFKERTIIERQVTHLTRLVDDLLDVSRITGGKIELARQRLDLSTVITSAIEIASPLLEQRRHYLAVDIGPQGLGVDGDAVRLAQIVSNLLTNAAKYTEPGGHITLTAVRDGQEVVLRVKDDGIGIDPQMLPRVFELFVQARQSIDRARGGLGLGLAIVRTLVTMHGGTVSASSLGLGHGSEFTIRLPAAVEAAPLPPAVPASEDAPGLAEPAVRPVVRRVLIVDDNTDAAELLARTLELYGHDTRVAHDASAALAIVESFRPDFAVLDIGLPVMDGYELARRLRQLPALAQLRLVAVTGYGQQTDRQRSSEAGFDVHLVKPVAIALLASLIAANE